MFYKIFILLLLSLISIVEASLPPGFFNNSGCLYAYVDAEKSTYLFKVPDRNEVQNGTLERVNYISGVNTCPEPETPGKLVMYFAINDNNMVGITLEFQVSISSHHMGYWEIDQATMKIDATNDQIYEEYQTSAMKVVDIYAGLGYSYSCSELVLENDAGPKENSKTKDVPHFKITLHRFQVQPFAELKSTVFAPSYDCSVWLSLPLVMGLILTLFIVFTVLIGVSLLMDQGNQTSDLRFSKQGGMLMNQAQLDATKG